MKSSLRIQALGVCILVGALWPSDPASASEAERIEKQLRGMLDVGRQGMRIVRADPSLAALRQCLAMSKDHRERAIKLRQDILEKVDFDKRMDLGFAQSEAMSCMACKGEVAPCDELERILQGLH